MKERTIIFAINNVEEKGNVVLKADFEILAYIDGFNELNDIEALISSNPEVEDELRGHIEDNGILYVVNIEGNEEETRLLTYECVLYLGEENNVIVDVMENDDRVITKVALIG